jgi:hypothetical protein
LKQTDSRVTIPVEISVVAKRVPDKFYDLPKFDVTMRKTNFPALRKESDAEIEVKKKKYAKSNLPGPGQYNANVDSVRKVA